MAVQNPTIDPVLSAFAPSVRASVADRLLSADLCAFRSSEYAVIPGFCDVHVHFREPGFSYKETILSGSLAAAHGGYTAV
ncbi:MAG: amidohydrolase family protein, partial [Firmicutes bacterium]|nr:amidohydrolase family protein [Bacillota bacterium]